MRQSTDSNFLILHANIRQLLTEHIATNLVLFMLSLFSLNSSDMAWPDSKFRGEYIDFSISALPNRSDFTFVVIDDILIR